MNRINDVLEVTIENYQSETGSLFTIDESKKLPFKITRSFIVQPSKAGVIRGKHAHKRLNQLYVCISGDIDVVVDDGVERKTFNLKNKKNALYVPQGIWSEQAYKSKESMLLVYCDLPYNENDYIRSYTQYLKYRDNKDIKLDGSAIRLNLGCGGRPLEGYINVDMDTLDDIKKRYPNQMFSDDLIIAQYDLFNLPYSDASVDEIRAEGLIEHLPFKDEPRFFNEIVRVLKPGGKVYLSTVDFEKTVIQWLDADDDWKDFFRDDEEAILNEHWFGTYSYNSNNRWGYMAATIYGSQNGAGQFHTNCYSETKLRAICAKLGLNVIDVERFRWKGDRDHMIGIRATKL